MFSFFPLQNGYDGKTLFNAELRFYNAVSANALDMAFRMADLNIFALKQAAENWSAKMASLALTDEVAMPQWLDPGHVKNDLENLAAYGQQFSKIMLELQADLAKILQQRATQTFSPVPAFSNGSSAAGSPPAGGEPALSFIQSMIEQANRGYAQWTSNALHAMETVAPEVAHAVAEKDPVQAAKPRTRK